MNFKKLAVLSALALTLVLCLMIFGGGRTRAAGPICTVPGDYATIQGAVNDVGCSTINVAAGIYAEQVTVTRSNLTITGAGAAVTIIKPSTVTANTSSLFSGAPIAAIVLVDGATGVTVEELTVDGSVAAFNACSPGYMGIFYRAGSGAILNTSVTNILHPSALGCQAVLGIFVQSGNGGSGLNANVVIDENVVDNYGKNGITANEAGTFVTVTDNIVTGRGPVGEGDAAQNGVQLGFGAHGKVKDNTISNNYYTPESFVACGLLSFQAGVGLGRTTTNTFSGNEQNVCTAGAGPSVHSPFND